MKKILLFFSMLIMFALCPIAFADEDSDEWAKHLDVYNGDGLDNPVNAVEYKKTMDELQKMKDRKNKKKKRFKKGEYPEPSNVNEPIKVEKDEVIKVTSPLYYDGTTIPVGFYKVMVQETDGEYYINLVQGKTAIIKIKANNVAHNSFAPDKVNYLNTEIYQDKYFKINYKTLDYALTGYLAILR